MSAGDVSLAGCVGAELGNTKTNIGSGVLLMCGDQLTPGPAATLTSHYTLLLCADTVRVESADAAQLCPSVVIKISKRDAEFKQWPGKLCVNVTSGLHQVSTHRGYLDI